MKNLKITLLALTMLSSPQLYCMEQPPKGPGKINWPTGESISRKKTFFERDRQDIIQDLAVLTAASATSHIALRYMTRSQFANMGAAFFLSAYLRPYLSTASARLFPKEIEAADASREFQNTIARLQQQQEEKK